MEAKCCPKCQTSKPVADFPKNRTKKDGLATYCKVCANQGFRERWPQAYPRVRGRRLAYAKTEKGRAVRRGVNLKARYGLSQADYDALLSEQGGACAICAGLDPRSRYGKFHVDHCHQTGKVRGLLCGRCNGLLGKMGDTLGGVARFVAYLQQAETR